MDGTVVGSEDASTSLSLNVTSDVDSDPGLVGSSTVTGLDVWVISRLLPCVDVVGFRTTLTVVGIDPLVAVEEFNLTMLLSSFTEVEVGEEKIGLLVGAGDGGDTVEWDVGIISLLNTELDTVDVLLCVSNFTFSGKRQQLPKKNRSTQVPK